MRTEAKTEKITDGKKVAGKEVHCYFYSSCDCSASIAVVSTCLQNKSSCCPPLCDFSKCVKKGIGIDIFSFVECASTNVKCK